MTDYYIKCVDGSISTTNLLLFIIIVLLIWLGICILVITYNIYSNTERLTELMENLVDTTNDIEKHSKSIRYNTKKSNHKKHDK